MCIRLNLVTDFSEIIDAISELGSIQRVDMKQDNYRMVQQTFLTQN